MPDSRKPGSLIPPMAPRFRSREELMEEIVRLQRDLLSKVDRLIELAVKPVPPVIEGPDGEKITKVRD